MVASVAVLLFECSRCCCVVARVMHTVPRVKSGNGDLLLMGQTVFF